MKVLVQFQQPNLEALAFQGKSYTSNEKIVEMTN